MNSFRSLFTASISISTLLAQGQCPIGNVTITSQADANAFAANYGSCDTLPGDLIIGPGDIDDYYAFSNVRMIQGDLRMQAIYPVPLDLLGFTQLAHIGGDLFINSTLTETFTGLAALERIDGDLEVQFAAMQNFTGLSALSVIGGDLHVYISSDMTSMNGLTELDTIYGSINMESIQSPNFSLIMIPPQLKYVGGDIRVLSQYATGMGGANALTHVGGSLNVQGPSLQNVNGFNNLSVAGDLEFHDAPVLTSISGFASLDSIGNYFRVAIPSLVSLSGFPELKVVGGTFVVGGLGLQSIAGFDQLTNVGTLTLADSPVLTSITAFDHPIEIEHLIIVNDPQLSYCHVQAVCEHLIGDPDVSPTIMNNANGCSSQVEIITFCELTTGVPLNESPNEPVLFPNPVKETFQISVEGPISSVQILDASLRHVLSATDKTIDVSALPAGHYIVVVRTDLNVYRRSFIKE